MAESVRTSAGSLELPRRRSGSLPTFIVIGAMKAGTTSLFHYLSQHPDVYMSPLKELDFFALEANWDRGVDWYRRQFAAAPEGVQAIGEASTVYTKFPHYAGIPQRMASIIPDARLIYVVRDPVERVRSHYEHRVAVGAETRSFDEAIESDPIYLDYSRYAMQLERYGPYFARERILVVPSETMRVDRVATIARVFAFLNVDPGFVPPNLATEFYRTQERTTWSPTMWRIRRAAKRYFPATKRAKEFVDTRLPHFGRTRPGERAISGEAAPLVTDAARRRISAALADDVTQLRAHVDGPFDGWGIS